MDDRAYQQLKELSWRNGLSPEQQARLKSYLSAHPEAREELEQERRLSELLAQLPDVPVSSNFTARVLQASRSAGAGQTKWHERLAVANWLRARWVPRWALAGLACAVLFLSVRTYEHTAQQKMARDLVKMSQVATLPEIQWNDFETIDRLTRIQLADSELLTVLR